MEIWMFRLHSGTMLCFGRKITHDFLCVKNKEECGRASVYRKYTKEIKDREHIFYSYFIKYKYRFPYMSVRSIACRRWADLTWAKVIFWFPGPRKAPG